MGRIQCQSSLPTDEYGEPEPDIAVLALEMNHYLETDPAPKDMLLVIEASNTTLKADLTIKQVLYARSGIPDYWVVDIPNRLLHVFREPTETGYASEVLLSPADEVPRSPRLIPSFGAPTCSPERQFYETLLRLLCPDASYLLLSADSRHVGYGYDANL